MELPARKSHAMILRMIEDLVFDVGMNHGEDTAHYLARDFHVVAIEANPVLVAENRERFHDAIEAGQLVIEPVGIHDHDGTATFWISDTNDDFSSFDESMGSRGKSCHSVEVECTTFSHLLERHGVPYYLKIDIERADRNCIESLPVSDLPAYVSIEAHEFDYLLILWKLGYRQFKVVDQMRHNSTLPLFSNENWLSRSLKTACWYADRVKNKYRKVKHSPGASGPFGEETAGPWLPVEEVAYNWSHFYRGHSHRGNLQKRSWYDFHAKL